MSIICIVADYGNTVRYKKIGAAWTGVARLEKQQRCCTAHLFPNLPLKDLQGWHVQMVTSAGLHICPKVDRVSTS